MSSSNDAETAESAGTTLTYVTSSVLPTPWATFQLYAFVETESGTEHLALALGNFDDAEPVLARVHSECLTGDALFSQRCDCGAQLESSFKRIAIEGRGVLLYLRQEGRGTELLNKIQAYRLQDEGADAVEANDKRGLAADLRRYRLCKPMLDHLHITTLRLMTNNPMKIEMLQAAGVQVVERIPLQVNRNPFNEAYLTTRAARLGNWLKEHLAEKEK
jgi:GTP cyclohydrolase II